MSSREWLPQITKRERQELLRNHKYTSGVAGTENEKDFKPVVKLFCITSPATWLLTEMSADGTAFGLCDLGMGFPELGYVHASDIEEMGFIIEKDKWFTAKAGISEYAKHARSEQRIIETW